MAAPPHNLREASNSVTLSHHTTKSFPKPPARSDKAGSLAPSLAASGKERNTEGYGRSGAAVRQSQALAGSVLLWRLSCYIVGVPAVPPDEHYLCLDMVCVSWTSGSLKASSDCAIVMEIWRSGAILQTDAAIPKACIITLAAPSGPIHATVSDCTQDDYGFVVEVVLEPSEHWFPNAYQPVHLMAK